MCPDHSLFFLYSKWLERKGTSKLNMLAKLKLPNMRNVNYNLIFHSNNNFQNQNARNQFDMIHDYLGNRINHVHNN